MSGERPRPSRIPAPGEGATARLLGLDSRGARATIAGIVAVVALAAGGWLLATSIGGLATVSRVLGEGERARAEVATVSRSVPNPVGAPDDEVVTTTVRFTTDAGEVVEAALPAIGLQPDYPAGSTIAVAYDPANPQAVVVDAPEVRAAAWTPVLWAAGVVAPGLASAALCVRILRRRPAVAR